MPGHASLMGLELVAWQFDNKELSIEVIGKDSGCRFIHGPLEHPPRESVDARGNRVAQITVPGPLMTDLHQFSLTWKGDVG